MKLLSTGVSVVTRFITSAVHEKLYYTTKMGQKY